MVKENGKIEKKKWIMFMYIFIYMSFKLNTENQTISSEISVIIKLVI